LTTSAQPPFFAYIPPHHIAHTLTFHLYLKDDSEENSYRHTFPISKEPGILEINLPPEVSLSLNQDYTWSVILACDELAKGSDPDAAIANGHIRRVELPPEVVAELEATPIDTLARAEIYAWHNIWYEPTKILYDQRQTHPHLWRDWLHSADLEYLSQHPSVMEGTGILK
jgi:hypothetical protein